jgi:putative hemolysin
MSFVPWLVILLLTLLTGLYVAAEFATVGVRKSRIQQLAQEGNRLAQSLLPVVQDGAKLDRYIAASQIGITVTSLVIGAYGQATLTEMWEPYLKRWGNLGEAAAESTAAVVVLVALTAFNVILGELVPKSLALQFPTQTALYTVLPMRWSLVLMGGFIAFLNGSGLLVLKLFGVQHTGHRHIHSPEEIEMLITESRDGGLLEEDESERLRQALQLTRRTAQQLMVPRPFITALDADTPVEEAIRTALESPYTRLPVFRGSVDHIIGVLHTKDLVGALVEESGEEIASIPTIEAVLRPPVIVPAGMHAERLLGVMREQRAQLVLVGDEYGGIEGLVTLEDVLAEMLGDVADEFKASRQPAPERLPDGRVRLSGLLRVDQAERWLGTKWEDEAIDADTVGGHVLGHLGHMPVQGERLVVSGVEVEVEAVEGNLVKSLLIRPAPPGSDNPGESERRNSEEGSRRG